MEAQGKVEVEVEVDVEMDVDVDVGRRGRRGRVRRRLETLANPSCREKTPKLAIAWFKNNGPRYLLLLHRDP